MYTYSVLRNAIYELPHKTYNEDTTLHTSSSPPPQINCPQPAMPSTLSPAELEALSTKAITAKATAYCMYRIHHSRHAIRKSANPPSPSIITALKYTPYSPTLTHPRFQALTPTSALERASSPHRASTSSARMSRMSHFRWRLALRG